MATPPGGVIQVQRARLAHDRLDQRCHAANDIPENYDKSVRGRVEVEFPRGPG